MRNETWFVQVIQIGKQCDFRGGGNTSSMAYMFNILMRKAQVLWLSRRREKEGETEHGLVTTDPSECLIIEAKLNLRLYS